MPLPRALARFNRTVTNPLARRFFMGVPGAAVIIHRGRRSGRAYRTPIAAFRRHGGFAVALTYGPGAEWVQNVLAAGGAVLEQREQRFRLVNPRIIRDADRRYVPPPVGTILRLMDVDAFLLLDYDDAPERTMTPVVASS